MATHESPTGIVPRGPHCRALRRNVVESDGNLGGRPSHEPTEQNRKTAEMLSGKGSTQEEIAALLDISVETLVKYYRKDLKLGKAKANYKVAEPLWDKAISKTIRNP